MHRVGTCDTCSATMLSDASEILQIDRIDISSFKGKSQMEQSTKYVRVFRNQQNIFQLLGYVADVASAHSQNSTLCRRSRNVCPVVPNDR